MDMGLMLTLAHRTTLEWRDSQGKLVGIRDCVIVMLKKHK
jgi:hypothetical protein